MRMRILALAGAAVAICGVTASGLALADGGGTPSTPEASPAGVVSDEKSGQRVNPDAGLGDEERHAKYTSLSALFWERYEAWAAAFNEADIDLRSLEQGEVDGSWMLPEPTLAIAVAKAELVVEVEAVSIEFGAHFSVTEFAVRSTLKGDVGDSITVHLNGGAYPHESWSFESAILGSAPNAPLLLPGDRAVLFLAQDANLGRYVIQPGSGFYRVEDGLVVPLEMNVFGDEVAGLSVAEFGAAVRAAEGE